MSLYQIIVIIMISCNGTICL